MDILKELPEGREEYLDYGQKGRGYRYHRNKRSRQQYVLLVFF